jgi:hypothetical protein
LFKSRFAAISGVAMNDPALGRFVDCRNNRVYLICVGRFRGTRLFLHCAQTRHNATISERSLYCLPGAFGG